MESKPISVLYRSFLVDFLTRKGVTVVAGAKRQKKNIKSQKIRYLEREYKLLYSSNPKNDFVPLKDNYNNYDQRKKEEKPNLVEFLSLGRYELLGKPDEIKEEDAKELVETLWNGFRNYSEGGSVGNYQRLVYKTALESFLSALKKEIFWNVNPIPTPEIQGGYDDCGNFHGGWDDSWISAFEEAQEKTFDRNRSIIFVKN